MSRYSALMHFMKYKQDTVAMVASVEAELQERFFEKLHGRYKKLHDRFKGKQRRQEAML